MKRREFISLLGGAAAAWPLAASAQEPGGPIASVACNRNPRNGPHFVAFFDELRQFGFMEGQNLTGTGRGYGLHIDQFAEIAAEMVRAKVDVILCAGDVATRAAQQATTTIPIVRRNGRYGRIRTGALTGQAGRQYDGGKHLCHRA